MTLANPFQDPLRFERRVPECTVVIFGANGDLTKRKLMPALYRLMYERRLSPGFAVVGVSRTAMSDDQFAAILPVTLASELPFLAENLRRSVEALRLAHPASSTSPFVTISIGGATVIPQTSQTLAELIDAADKALYRAKHAGRNRAAFREA